MLFVIKRLKRFLGRDEGSALMFVVVGLPVMIVVFAIAVDVGSWYVHKRALQNDVDAAVFAGSQLWGSCFRPSTVTPAWLPMQQEAQNYDGETGFAHNYNPQVGGTLKGNLGVAFNSTTFPLSQPPNAGPDDTPSDSCALTRLSDGANHYIFDVKATEQNVPLIFGNAFPGVIGPTIHATARTELDQVESLSGLRPIGVTDPSPKWMFAQFVDEDDADSPLTGWIQLCKGGAVGCSGTLGTGNELWTSQTTTAVHFPTTSHNAGVRLKYVWGGPDPNLDCGTSALVDCYDNVPSAAQSNGLTHIWTWTPGAAGVHLENVWMLSGTCTDGYFAAGTCDAGVQAEVNLGTHPVHAAWSNGRCDTGCAQVWATVDNAGTYQLAPPAAFPVNGLGLLTWTLASGATLPSTGPHLIRLKWQWKQTAGTWQNGATTLTCTNGAGNPCQVAATNFNVGNPVQRAWVADNLVRSGPVQGISIWSNAVTSGANSFQQGSTQNLGVIVRNPCFETQLADPSCPLVTLRVSASATGSESQSLDCDPNYANIKLEIANGCRPNYTTYPNVSGNSACPTQSALWSNANPPNLWDCVAVQTGNGDLEGGLQDRIGTDPATCGNHWPNFPADDKRQIPLFLVPYSAFNVSGSNKTYPVIGFGAFYITGYFHDPCPNATTSGLKHGDIPGYFITYIPDGNTTPSSRPCDPLELTPCIPVLVK
jgi:hypothetical protein